MITELERRLHTIAQMAATLEAGDRACPSFKYLPINETGRELTGDIDTAVNYAARATRLFDAVDTVMATSGTIGAANRE